MSTVRQLFEGVKDKELMHQKFVRFGKGLFERYIMTIKRGKNLKVKASYDWSNDLFEMIAENIKEEAELTGKIICNYDFEKELPCEAASFSKRGKLYTAELNTTATPEVMKQIYDKFKQNFLLVNVKSGSFQLKCGKSLPKPGKDLKDNFCSATLPKELIDKFAFAIGKDFKEAKIKHLFDITDIEIPKEDLNNPEKARTSAVRKGKLRLVAEVDGKNIERETGFAA